MQDFSDYSEISSLIENIEDIKPDNLSNFIKNNTWKILVIIFLCVLKEYALINRNYHEENNIC